MVMGAQLVRVSCSLRVYRAQQTFACLSRSQSDFFISSSAQRHRSQKRRKMKPVPPPDVPPVVREKMKKAFNECYKAVVACEEEDTGRKRCELFKELPDKRARLSLYPARRLTRN
jgi:hypothetical protein